MSPSSRDVQIPLRDCVTSDISTKRITLLPTYLVNSLLCSGICCDDFPTRGNYRVVYSSPSRSNFFPRREQQACNVMHGCSSTKLDYFDTLFYNICVNGCIILCSASTNNIVHFPFDNNQIGLAQARRFCFASYYHKILRPMKSRMQIFRFKVDSER